MKRFLNYRGFLFLALGFVGGVLCAYALWRGKGYWLALSGNAKICVIHKNAEGLLNNITAPVSAAGLNIENMVSKSKKDYAYTCLDVKGDASGIEAAIKAVSGVVSVRVIK